MVDGSLPEQTLQVTPAQPIVRKVIRRVVVSDTQPTQTTVTSQDGTIRTVLTSEKEALQTQSVTGARQLVQTVVRPTQKIIQTPAKIVNQTGTKFLFTLFGKYTFTFTLD